MPEKRGVVIRDVSGSVTRLGFFGAMKVESYTKTKWVWPASAIVCTLLVAWAAFLLIRSPQRSRATITIDSNGTARLGVLPLHNKTIRHLSLTAIGHLNSKVSVSAAEGAPLTNVMDMFNAMNRAGITSVVVSLRLEPTASAH